MRKVALGITMALAAIASPGVGHALEVVPRQYTNVGLADCWETPSAMV